MALIFFTLIFFFFFFLPFSFTLQPPTTTILQRTCNATTDYDFCISSLSSDPSAAAADVKTISTIAINLAISNATTTSSFASALSKATKGNNNPSLAALLSTCADKYIRASEALRSSLEDLVEENYDYAYVEVSSAAEYPNVCRVLFGQSRGEYPAEMAKREAVLERLCAVALQIISLLG